jgi:TolB-like protein/Tfp pilus assembly protein PilF
MHAKRWGSIGLVPEALQPSYTPMASSGRVDRLVSRRGPVPGDVKKAVDYLRQNVGRNIAMSELAAASGVAERTLRKHFGAFVGVSPLEYSRRLRLAAVRKDLLAGTDSTSVTDAATRHGFGHFGRFSSHYRRHFGEAPSATLRRGRAQAESERTSRAGSSAGNGSMRLSRERPSVAALPFQVSTTEPSQLAFAESLVAGIAGALSRVCSISVLMPPFSRTAAGCDPQRLARDLGARYFLTGRIVQVDARLRVIVSLLDTATTRHVWGDAYDGETGELLGLHDRVTEGVVGAILPSIRASEIERARRKPPQDLGAYDLTMQAFPFVFATDPAATLRALELLDRAIEVDPDYAVATGLTAWCHGQLVLHNGTHVPANDRARALLLANRASVLDADDPLVLTARCGVHAMAREFDVADALLARALALDPTSAWAWERSGWLKAYQGDSETAIGHMTRAIRLDPSRPSNANRFIGVGCAHFNAGRYDQCAVWMRRALLEQPGTAWVTRALSVAYARSGERFAALDALDTFRRYRPDVTIGQVVAAIPFTPNFLDRIADTLSDLGLPP